MIDAHAHLLNEKFNASDIISSMRDDRLDKIVNIGTDVADSRQGIVLAKNNKNVFCTVGIHPEYADNTTDADVAIIDELASSKKVVAIGEIGLDYHFGATEEQKQKQKELFVRQIKIASRHNLPIVIHCRDAADDVLEILKEHRHLLLRVVMHCYSEGGAYMPKFRELDCYFSFTGNITFKKVDRTFLKDIPQNRIMVETDAPWLSPEPLRGTTNYPKNVWLTAQKIADTLEMSLEKFDTLSSDNTKTFYNLP
ncbi:MAG: TatD family hydrolase [Clostridia bacterium]|nr:TatD family hydrolase [Clostridia bacterium]